MLTAYVLRLGSHAAEWAKYPAKPHINNGEELPNLINVVLCLK